VKDVPSYTKILTLGATGTERALMGEVIIQEKVDGSQFRFGLNEDGELTMASHHATIYPENPGMFGMAADHAAWAAGACYLPRDTYFYCEYLAKPKHNTLAYESVPFHHLVLFDVLLSDGGWVRDHATLDAWARSLDIDVVPELYRGVASLADVQALLATPSFLGKETVEGVVIKNWGELIAVGGTTFPLFTKHVNEAFKERHGKEWKRGTGKNKRDTYVESFAAEGRWAKAVQHLRERGELVGAPKDIGALVREVQDDIDAEETKNIKEELYRLYIGDIKRAAVRGLPEWYKVRLLENVEEASCPSN